ncbi:WYL domain-containing protein [Epidermidibacterium keratini]|uniref:WYL domain-containing protein n=1 Tax=Epidermidibacterium keratini TaxID=1891644 RepID=A0A7L4YSH4_9ACTN|nr:WYL domain-containing protein [Epidermidibacterium keratini]QHC02126.1 WYL domain-containing protein [Epidermidibacterium keratini]
MADVTERTLALLATLQSRRSFTGPELTARLGVSERTLRRDVERLRRYGYPVHTQPGPGGHYRLAGDRAVPPLVLSDDEAVAALAALAAFAAHPGIDGEPVEDELGDAATRAYGKLDQLLPARLRPRLATFRNTIEASAPRVPKVSARSIETISAAIADDEIVTFDYRDAHGDRSRRRVEPHRQVHHLLRWYLLAWDCERAGWRVFRLDRITRLRRTARRFTPRPLPAESALAYLQAGLGKDREVVRVIVDAPAERIIDAFRYEDIDVREREDGRCELVVRVEGWQWFALHLAMLDADFTIERDAGLGAELRRFGARLLTATERDRR